MLSGLLSVAVIVAVSAGLVTAAPVDACTAATLPYWVSSAQAHACELAIPYSPSRSAKVIDSAIKALQYYSTENWFLNSPNGKIPHSINIRQLLTNVQAKVGGSGYSTDWDFNSAVTDAFNREQDGHTIFIASCATAFSYNLPVSVATFGDSETSTSSHPFLLVNYDFPEQGRPGLEAYYLSMGIDVRPYDRMRILTVDYAEAQAYFVNLGDQSLLSQGLFGSYESLSPRYQRLMSRYSADTTSGAFTQEPGRYGMRTYYPGQDIVRFVLQAANGTQYTISMPWSAHFSANTTLSTAQFQATLCLATGVPAKRNVNVPASVQRLQRKAIVEPDGTEEQRAVAAQIAAAAFINKNYVTPNLTSFGTKVTTIDIYQLKDHPKVGVIYMEQFSPSDGTSPQAFFKGYSNALYTGISQLKAAGVKHILIDQSGNRGGYIYNGAIALWSLFPTDLYPGFPAVYRDLALSHRESVIASNTNSSFSEYNFRGYRDLNYNLLQNNSQFMDPPQPQLVNGVQDAFSVPFFDDFGEASDVTNFTSPPFDGVDIVLVANGICASTCSIFSSYLFQKHGVRSAVFGGNPVANRWSFDGGVKGSEVTSYSEILSELAYANMSSDPGTPQALPIRSSFNLNYRNAIPYVDQQFGILEYVYEDATKHYQFTADNFNNPQKIWEFVAEQFFGQN